MNDDPILGRLRAVNWTDQGEPTVCSQLIVPVLMLLGYGEDTRHRIEEQKVYTLKDPTLMKGIRKVRLDYRPRVYEEGLWVMEAKGLDEEVTPETLGQVRDYAIHPEIRAALMVTVDKAGFRIFDPWDENWDEPLLTVPANEVADRIEELRVILGVDHVADVIRRRHLDHLRRTLSASLEFGVLSETEQEFRELLKDARATIDANRLAIHRKSAQEAEERKQRVLKASGAWGVAQHHNTPWIGSLTEARELARAVMMQDARQRPTQLLQVRQAIEAVYRDRCKDETQLYRPLWWLNIVILASCIELRGKEGCEPYATEMARQGIRDTLLGFPDDGLAAASWRFQRVFIPLAARIGGYAPLNELSAQTQARMSAEDKIRWRADPSWFLMHGVRMTTIRKLTEIDPWDAGQLDRETAEAQEALEKMPIPDGEWVGPIGDPWLQTWADVDPLQMCGIAVLLGDEDGDELIVDDDLRGAIGEAANSEHRYLTRIAEPLAERLGLA